MKTTNQEMKDFVSKHIDLDMLKEVHKHTVQYMIDRVKAENGTEISFKTMSNLIETNQNIKDIYLKYIANGAMLAVK